MITTTTLVVVHREVRVIPKGGGVITGGGAAGELLVGAAGPAAADRSTRAAAVAGTMLGVLAAVVSLVWALYQFKPGLIAVAGVGPSTAAQKSSADNLQTRGSQETPLLALSSLKNGPSAGGTSVAIHPEPVQTTDVDLANYFSPMTTTTNHGIQADLDTGDGGTATVWTVSSASALTTEEATKSRTVLVGGSVDGTGTTDVGTQTSNVAVGSVEQGRAAGDTVPYSAYSYESRAISDTTRNTSHVRTSPACLKSEPLTKLIHAVSLLG